MNQISAAEDNAENREICKKFCETCPKFRENRMKETPLHSLFCARGKSQDAPKAVDKGCNCFGCGVLTKYKLKGGYFCLHGTEGPK